MHPMFADWYRVVDLKPEEETLDKRWESIAAFSKEAALSDWLDLVRLYIGDPRASVKTAASFTQRFKSNDTTFSLTHDAELQVLAGAALLQKLDSPSAAADAIALALVSANLQGKGRSGPLLDASDRATSYLREEGLRVREGTPETNAAKLSATALNNLRKVEVQALSPSPNWAVVDTNFQQIASAHNELLAALRRIYSSIGAVVRGLQKGGDPIDPLREETNMLWWLFSERSQDLGVPFKAIGPHGSIPVIAKEAADLTILFPGPVGIPEFLAKALDSAGSNGEELSLSDAVNASPRDWRESWLRNSHFESVSDLTPILRALRTSLSTDDQDGWVPVYDKEAKQKASTTLPAKGIALQVYTECLLTRVLDGEG